MGLFDKPEVIILKESSDAKAYLNKLEDLAKKVTNNAPLSQKLEKEIAITKAGIVGEDQILFELKNSGMNLVVLHDIYIEDPNGNGAQIDFLVISPYVDVIIECKNLFGNIEINNKGDFIRTIEYGSKKYKEGIYSPITQNERHMRVYKECRKADKGLLMGAIFEKRFDHFHKSLIVLANPKTVVNDRFAPAVVKKQVIRVDQLIKTLREYKSDAKSNKQQMLAFGKKVLAMNIEERKDYFAKFEELQNELQNTSMVEDKVSETMTVNSQIQTNSAEKKICPRCGKELVKRIAKRGDNQGNSFWGCTGFPKCKYIENI